jgi:3-oxoacyl-[acyl-carrier protein] reductase
MQSSAQKDSLLTGHVAIVTGAARGIGQAISLRLATLGAHVLLVARDLSRLDALKSTISQAGGTSTVYPLDLRDASAVQSLGATLREQHKRCDILVNNAGVGRIGKPLHLMSPDEWDETMETNLRGPFLLIREVVPLMIDQGSGDITNISSLAGRNPLPNGVAYSASKWALNGLTYGLAEELRPHNIRVSAVAPGSVNTGFGKSGEPDQDERAARKIQPDDLASVVEMLLRQPRSTFVSEVLMRPTSKS